MQKDFGPGILLNTTDTFIPLTGFNKKNYNTLLNDLSTRVQVMFGGAIDLTPTSPLYHIFDAVTMNHSEEWDALEDIYYSTSIESAEGKDLDNLGIAVGMPRYRPAKASGKVVITRYRNEENGLFYRYDRDSGFLLQSPSYVFYEHPMPDYNSQNTLCEIELYHESLRYHEYFDHPLPEHIIDNALIFNRNNNAITYRLDTPAILTDSFGDTPYMIEANISAEEPGGHANVSQFYQQSFEFPGAVNKIISDPRNPYSSQITNVFQGGLGEDELIIGVTTLLLTITRSDASIGNLIITNGWHWFDKQWDISSNGTPKLTQIQNDLITTDDLIELLQKRNEIDPETKEVIPESAIEIIEQKLRKHIRDTNPRYKIAQTPTFDAASGNNIYEDGERIEPYRNKETGEIEGNPLENITIAWKEPDNYTNYSIDFRNSCIEDPSVWWIPDPCNERHGLFLYFRPTETGLTDYLAFRPLLNSEVPYNAFVYEIPVVYVGFANTRDMLYNYRYITTQDYSRNATHNIKGFVGLNHRGNSGGSTDTSPPMKILPARGDRNYQTLYNRPILVTNSGLNNNVGCVLHKEDIDTGKDFESDAEYRYRLGNPIYIVTATNPAITDHVKSVTGVLAARSYDALLNPIDINSNGFKVRLRTEDGDRVFKDDTLNTPIAKQINDLVRVIKPAGVNYMYDYGTGYGVRVKIVVVGANYPFSQIELGIRLVLREYIRSLKDCIPLEYSTIIDIVQDVIGVVKINDLTIFSGDILNLEDNPMPVGDIPDRKYIFNKFREDRFGPGIYLPCDSHAFFDESEIIVNDYPITEVVVVGRRVSAAGCTICDINCDIRSDLPDRSPVCPACPACPDDPEDDEMIICVDIDKTPNEIVKAYARFKDTWETVYYREVAENSNLIFKIPKPRELQEVVIDINANIDPNICLDVHADCIKMQLFTYNFSNVNAALQLRYTRELNQSNYISIHPTPFASELMNLDEFPTMIRFNFRDCNEGECPPCPKGECSNCDLVITSPGRLQPNILTTFTYTTTKIVDSATWYVNGEVIQSSSHRFTQVGTYNVSLRITATENGEVCYCDASIPVTVTTDVPPPCLPGVVSFTNGPLCGTLPHRVLLTDTSTNGQFSREWWINNIKLAVASSPFEYPFTTAGSHIIKLVSKGDCDGESERTIVIKTPPCAPDECDLSISGTQGICPEDPAKFTYDSRLDVISWNWNFGDGNTSELANPPHIYTNQGIYTVTLDVVIRTHSELLNCFSNSLPVTVNNAYCLPICEGLVNFKHESCIGNEDDPLKIQFTDLSANDPHTWFWNFGDGNTSTLQNPSHIYNTAGTYKVTFDAIGTCKAKEIIERFITISEHDCDPCCMLSIISSDTFICSNKSVTFDYRAFKLDNATLNDSEIIAWLWNFGDGNTSESARPTYTYTSAGPRIISLQITTRDYCGCSATMSINVGEGECCTPCNCCNLTIDAPRCVEDYLEPIRFKYLWDCRNPITSFSWSFGDGFTSDRENPIHVYGELGRYHVTLRITSIDAITGECCECTAETYVIVADTCCEVNEVKFTHGDLCGLLPHTVTYEVSGNPTSWVWEYEDARGYHRVSSSVSPQLAVTYTKEGNYEVYLEVDGCWDPYWKYVDITGLSCCNGIVNFRYVLPTNPDELCVPLPIEFIDLSVPSTDSGKIISWIWTFGDGEQLKYGEKWPELPPKPDKIVHTYIHSSYIEYDVVLAVEFENCAGAELKEILIDYCYCDELLAGLDIRPNEGCLGPTFAPDFIDKSIGNPDTWLWEVKRSVNITGSYQYISDDQNPDYEFTESGQYIVRLTVSKFGTCDEEIISSDTMLVSVLADCDDCERDDLPVADFDVYPTEGCPTPLTVEFTDWSWAPDDKPITEWIWVFEYDKVKEEVVKYLRYDADNIPSKIEHTYDKEGSYEVALLVKNKCGEDVLWQCCIDVCVVPDCKPDFRVEPEVCVDRPVDFEDLSYRNNCYPEAWHWDFGNGKTSDEEWPETVYTQTGIYFPSLTVTYEHGVTIGPVRKQVKVIECPCEDPCDFPQARFIADPTYACPGPLTVQFTDDSWAPDECPITSWSWDFDNDQTSDKRHPDPVTYTKPGEYTVSLTVTNECGPDTWREVGLIEICEEPDCEGPFADFTGEPLDGDKLPHTVTFEDLSDPGGDDREIISWLWNFGDGKTSEEQHPVHTYTTRSSRFNGCFDVSLTVRNDCEKPSTFKETNFVCIGLCTRPVAKIDIYQERSEIEEYGKGVEVEFTDISELNGRDLINRNWVIEGPEGNPDVIITSTEEWFSKIFYKEGLYKATLTVTTCETSETEKRFTITDTCPPLECDGDLEEVK